MISGSEGLPLPSLCKAPCSIEMSCKLKVLLLPRVGENWGLGVDMRGGVSMAYGGSLIGLNVPIADGVFRDKTLPIDCGVPRGDGVCREGRLCIGLGVCTRGIKLNIECMGSVGE